MGTVPKGWADKLYWRRVTTSTHHCFTRDVSAKTRGGRVTYTSLCGNWMRTRSGGQAIERPPLEHRCVECNRLEMERRGWDKPGPER